MRRFTLRLLSFVCLFAQALYAQGSADDANPKPPQPGAGMRIFLLIGQSNMAGRGEIDPQKNHPVSGIWMLNPYYEWVPAVDPLHNDKETAGVGLGRSFAKELIDHCDDVEIGLVPCAYGGTSLSMWQPGEHLYRNAMYRIKYSKDFGVVSGILWHQGEADADSLGESSSYSERWLNVVNSMREELKLDLLPVVAGTLGDFVQYRRGGEKKYAPLINEQLLSLESLSDRIGVVDAGDLAHKGDELHFSSDALETLGERYARKFIFLNDEFCNP